MRKRRRKNRGDFCQYGILHKFEKHEIIQRVLLFLMSKSVQNYVQNVKSHLKQVKHTDFRVLNINVQKFKGFCVNTLCYKIFTNYTVRKLS
mgnify:CR=1 FL=1